MKTEPAMPLYIGDYLRDTQGLTREEHGSYMLLIMAYWSNGGPLLNDDPSLKSIARCPDAQWARTRGLMERFFDVSNGVWKHKRIDEEIEKSKRRLAISQMGVQARRDKGQIPVEPTVTQTVSPSVRLINLRAELERVEKRIEEIRQQGTLVAGSPMKYTTRQKSEMIALKYRREELKKLLGFVA